VARREPSVRNCIGFVDDLSVPVRCCSEAEAQNKEYNEYRHDTHVNNVLAFLPTGLFCLCVDQGFPRSGSLFKKFVGPTSKKTKKEFEPMLRDLIVAKSALFTSLRQATEWRMRALQVTFSRLKARL